MACHAQTGDRRSAGRGGRRAAQAPEAAARVVTISPDVSSSTNLDGRLNKAGVWAPAEQPGCVAYEPAFAIDTEWCLPAAADRLDALGHPTDVVCVSSAGLLFHALRARDGHDDGPSWILGQAFPVERAAPMVTVLDGHPHTLAFLAAINRVACAPLGVTDFGRSGGLGEVYGHHGLDADSIVRAGIGVLDRDARHGHR